MLFEVAGQLNEKNGGGSGVSLRERAGNNANKTQLRSAPASTAVQLP